MHSEVTKFPAALMNESGIGFAPKATSASGAVPSDQRYGWLESRMMLTMTPLVPAEALSREQAIRLYTINNAFLHNEEKTKGSLEVGKAADLVLYDGDCFENRTHVTYTILGGRIVYDRGDYLKMPFARRALPLSNGGGPGCCLGVW